MPGTACLSAHPPTPTAQAGALLGVPVCAYWQWTRVQRSPHVEPSRTGLIPWSSEGCGVCLGSFWVFASHDHLGMGSLRAWGGCESVLSGVVRRVKQMGAGRRKRWAGPQTTFTSLTILLWAGPSWGPGVTGERPLGIRPKVRVALTSASGQGGWGWQLWEKMLGWAGWGLLRFQKSRGMMPGWSSRNLTAVGGDARPTALEGPEVLIALQESGLQTQKKTLLVSHRLQPQRPDVGAWSRAHPASVLGLSWPRPSDALRLAQEPWSLVPAVCDLRQVTPLWASASHCLMGGRHSSARVPWALLVRKAP